MNMQRLCENIEAELKTISDRGLNSNNMDTAQKLLDMYKNCKKVESMEGSYQRGDYSEGRNYGRDNYGRDNYGRDYNSYGERSYSHGQDLVKELENVVRDISNPEDRQKVQKLIGKMRDM